MTFCFIRWCKSLFAHFFALQRQCENRERGNLQFSAFAMKVGAAEMTYNYLFDIDHKLKCLKNSFERKQKRKILVTLA